MATAPANEPFVFVPSANRGRRGGGATSTHGFSHAGHTNDGPIVDQTRREIAEIVREIASKSRQEIPLDSYLRFLCDRTLRAMAAEGVVIWGQPADHRHHPAIFEPLSRIGRITDQSIAQSSFAAHQRLLLEVAQSGEPVVVPSTPQATDSEIPANPTDFPAAIVSIAAGNSAPSPRYLIEVFLEPDGGVATQRGYLRFVAQVADLAGEYFRDEQLRTLIAQQTLAEHSDTAIAIINRAESGLRAANLAVDSIADLFHFARVALCDVRGRGRVISVSHVDTIDHRSDAVRNLITAANEISLDLTPWWNESLDDPVTEAFDGSQTESSVDAQHLEVIAVFGLPSSQTSRSARIRTVESPYRIVALNRAGENRNPQGFPAHVKRELNRLAENALLAIERRSQRQSLAWLNRFPSTAKRLMSWGLFITIAACLLLIPIPKTVDVPATLRPSSMLRLTATRDAIVDQVHVEHGQSVQRGDLLLSLVDPSLEQKMTELVGRRAVLVQRHASLTESIVDGSSRDFDQIEKVQGQRGVVEEEIASVDQQMRLLSELRGSLQLRSDRDGIIDAWQVQERLANRPVHRGEPLLQVVSQPTKWLVDARVPQNRIATLRTTGENEQLLASVTLHDQPERILPALLEHFGPVLAADHSRSMPNAQTAFGERDLVSVTLSLSMPQDEDEAHHSPLDLRNEAPAQVVFHCGKSTLGDFLFGDLYRSVVRRVRLHLGPSTVAISSTYEQK
ncbi:hypothetical protein Pla22_44080 [Rubripirellula amarantea]|uniref:HlyD family secretion protein n=1 Tax=Rubripirellula amarantea TaxID=2527999 RepID=A0A5C5WE22_9BACT|nr:HlyD family efflux transporter periplasmic adaptor subunit [Rubripirellula amarantea]TWT49216.1 hypothetical protein Pla22_44080 [Rubripirellula amarantea]